jgi:hypothetical protein
VAVDPLFDGLISIRVQDEGAAAQLGEIIQALQARMAELANMPGVQLGEQVFGGVEAGATATMGVLEQLKVALADLRTAGRAYSAEPIQNEGTHAAMRSGIEDTDLLINKLRQLMIVQQEAQLTAVSTAKVQAEASGMAAAAPVVGAGNRQLAALGLQMGPGGVVTPIGAVSGGLSGAEGLAGVKAQISATTGVGEGTPLEEAQAKLVAAQSRLTMAIDKEYATVEQRTAALSSGISNLIAADRRVVAAEESQALAAEKAAAAPMVAPVLSGIDQMAPAKVQQLQLDASIAVAKEQTLLAAKEGTVTEVALAQARIRTLAVEERLTAAMEEQAVSASGGGGGMFGGGMSGMTMLKYYGFFMAFQEGSRLLREVKVATEEYSLAVNQLTIALGGNHEQAVGLAETYSTIGQNLATAPAIAVDAATKYTRFFRDTSGVAGAVGAQLGSTVNLLEGAKSTGAFGDPAARAIANDKTLGELGAIAQNYERDAMGASKLYDAATVIAQHYGQQLGGSLLGGTAQIADLLKQSGFTAEQGLALTGSVMQYTGNTSEQAAGDLKRFLGRQGSATFNDVFAEFQINQNQSLRDELVQLGAKFQDLSETQRAKVISTLGGGRAGAAVVAAITDLPAQTSIAAEGANSVGVAFDQAQARLGTFAGRLEQIVADWSALSKDMGTSGLGSVFGDALGLVDPLLRGVDALVSGFAVLPGYVKQFLEVLALASVAGRIFGGSFGLVGMTNMLDKVGGIGAGAAEVVSADATAARVAALGLDASATGVDTAAIEVNTVAAGENAIAQGAAAGAADVASVSLIGRLGALAGAAGGAALALAPFVAAVAGIALLGEVWGSYGKSQDAATQTAAAFTAHANAKTADEKASAAAEADTAINALQAAQEGIGGTVLYGANSGTGGERRLRNPRGPVTGPESGLYKQSADLQAQLQANSDADYRASLTPAQQTYEDLKNFSLTHTTAPTTSLAPGVSAVSLTPAQQSFAGDYTDVNRGINNLATTHASVSKSIAMLRDELAHIPDTSLADFFTPQPGSKGGADELKRLTTQIGRTGDPIQREADLGAISSLTAEASRRAAGTDQQDAADAMYDTALKAYHQAVLGNVKSKVDSIHAMQSDNAASQGQIRNTVSAALREFASTGDIDSVVGLLAGVDKAFITTFNRGIAAERKILQDQLAALEAAAGAAANAAIDASSDPRQQAIIANRSITNVTPAEKAKQDAIAKDVAIANSMAKAAALAVPGGSDFTWPKDKAATGPTAAQIEEARLAAQAIPGDPMSAAITNLRVAQYKMSEPKNQVEYWTALKALHDAQYAYSMAVQAAANDARQLGEDLTNPLVVAREKVREAADQLTMDQRRGALPDVINKDKLALKQAQSAAEKSAFDQQFSDQQTNYNLQRESLSAYLSYLNSQHNYLSSVQNKTRQQVDELNQVDQALQGLANQMQGQFNLGAIKVPTAYEARAIGAGGLTTNVQITINGTDIPAVKAILTQYLGQGAMSTVGSSARKV